MLDVDAVTAEFRALRPAGGFRVISADPPWSFENYSEKGEAKNPNQHYDCMTMEEICLLPVAELAAPDCAVLPWVTWPLMPWWNVVLKAWGFEFKGLAWEWIKFNPETGKYAFGPGYGSRKNLEPCLLAARGSPSLAKPLSFFGVTDDRANSHSVRDFIEAMPLDCIRAPRREHSRKPDEHFTRVETMFDGPYVELFAREPRKNWTVWGNEVNKFSGVAS